ARFSTYLDLLLRWNERINLTAITEPRAILDRHFLDSLVAASAIEGPGRLIDVGSGAGFPGVPIALVRPGLHVTLLEPTQKKAAFLRALLHALPGLAALVDQRRMEQIVQGTTARFDWAISRATFPPEDWLKEGAPLLRPGGTLMVMTGRDRPPA